MPAVKLLLRDFDVAFVAVCLCVIAVMAKKRLIREFPAVSLSTLVLLIKSSILTGIMFYRKPLGIPIAIAYKTYFYTYWGSDLVMAALQVLIIYGVFSAAMRPLEGLHSIGKNVFRWVAAVSIMVCLAVTLGPHGASSLASPAVRLGMVTTLAQQMDQGIGVLTMCLLLFVCFTTKPLGLTFRSRIFGTLLGLGVMATTTLIQSAWSGISPSYSLYSAIAVFGVVSDLCAILVWGTYFVLPEPERKLILLPTASPYFYWNHLSEALGDEPGHVVVGGLSPAAFAEAELVMFSAPDSDLPNAPMVTDFETPMLQSPRFASAS